MAERDKSRPLPALSRSREPNELLVALGIDFLEPLLLAGLTRDVDADVAGPQPDRLYKRRKPGHCAAGRTVLRISSLRIGLFFDHSLKKRA